MGSDIVISLKKRFIGYDGSLPKEMMTHVQKNSCIKLTMKDRKAFKTEGYAEPWDMTKSVSTYFKYPKDFKARLDNCGIKTSKEEMVDAAVTAMWDSKYFT